MDIKIASNVNLSVNAILGFPRALGYIATRPKFIGLILLCILINIIVFILVAAGFYYGVLSFVNSLVSLSDQLTLIVNIITIIIGLVFTVLIFSAISGIVSSPIYSYLSELVADEAGIDQPPPKSYQFLRDIKYSAIFEIKKLLLTLFILITTLIIAPVPILGQALFIIVNPLQIVIFSGLDLFEPALARKRLRFRTKLYFILSKPTFWVYLFPAGLLVSIPILNIVTTPIAIVGGILVYKDHELARQT